MLKNLDRLTIRHPKIKMADAKWRDMSYPCFRAHMDGICPQGQDCHGDCDFARLLERLAAYEDTRLTPNDIAKMKAEVKRLRERVKMLSDTNRQKV